MHEKGKISAPRQFSLQTVFQAVFQAGFQKGAIINPPPNDFPPRFAPPFPDFRTPSAIGWKACFEDGFSWPSCLAKSWPVVSDSPPPGSAFWPFELGVFFHGKADSSQIQVHREYRHIHRLTDPDHLMRIFHVFIGQL